MRIVSFLSIAWKLKEQLWSVFPPKFFTGWLVLVLVNVCYLLQSWLNFSTISCCFLFDTALLLFLWLACLPCHPRFCLCASCSTSPGLHTFGPVVFVNTRKQAKRTENILWWEGPFLATNVLIFELPNLKIIHVLYNNSTMSIESETLKGGEWTIRTNAMEDAWYGDKRKCNIVL